MSVYSKMRVRYNHCTDFAYPQNVVSTMRPQILNTWLAVLHHFKNRHSDAYKKHGGSAPCKDWVQALKKIDKGSGFAHALKQCKGA